MNILTNDVNIDGTINANSVDLDPNTPGQQTTLTVPGQGTYTVNSSGVLTFTPLSTFYGNTTPIQYTVANSLGLVSNPGTISFTVVPAGAPFAANDIISTLQNNTVTYNIAANDTDDVSINVSRIDFDPNATGFQQSYYVTGKGQFSADASGILTFTPDWNFSGTVTARYTIRDNMNLVSNIATIQVQVQWVNTPPFALDDVIDMNEDASVTFNALTNDYDIDNPILANSVDLNPVLTGRQTSRVVSGEGTYTVNNSGIVTFTPVANFNGYVTPIGYTIKDSLNLVSDSAVFIINVQSINDAPVSVNDTVYGPGTQGTNSITFNILTNDFDIDGTLDATSIDLDPVASGIQKTYTVSGEGIYSVDSLGNVTFSYSFNTPTGGCTPINYIVFDNQGASSLSSNILVDILDLGVPTANDDVLFTYKNYPILLDPTLNDIDNGSGIDPTLTALIGNLSSANGTWSITNNVIDTPDFVNFVPANNFTGNVSIFYTIKNNDSVVSNQAKITITVRDLPSPTISNPSIFSKTTSMLYGNVSGSSDSVVLFKNGVRIGVVLASNGQWVMSGIDSSIFNVNDQITARNYIEGFASAPSNIKIVEPKPIGLSVSISSFQSTCNNDFIAIQWTTSSEKNNDRFELYRSSDAKDWQKIYTVKGQGTKASETLYSVNDMEKQSKYYRLKDIDFNGKEQWSEIIFSECNSKIVNTYIYPNPASDFFKIITNQNPPCKVELFDQEGKLLKSIDLISNQAVVEIRDLNVGIYVVKISTISKTESFKLIKK
jgi:CshA-type fibril repeat protein